MSMWKGSLVALLLAAVWTLTILAVDRRNRASQGPAPATAQLRMP